MAYFLELLTFFANFICSEPLIVSSRASLILIIKPKLWELIVLNYGILRTRSCLKCLFLMTKHSEILVNLLLVDIFNT